MGKVAYIIPGFTDKISQKKYKTVIRLFKAKGFKTIPITISWKYKTMSDYVVSFLQQYKPNKRDKIYLFGFSFGAMIAFISASQTKPKMMMLCSLAPFFKEDLPFLKNSEKGYIGKKRIKDFKNYSFNEAAKKITCNTILMVGDKEDKDVRKRAGDAHTKLKNSRLVVIPQTKHDIGQKEYLGALQKVILRL